MSHRGRVAAFFDLDGTLIVPPSLEFRFAAYLARQGELRLAPAFSWLRVFLKEGIKALATRGGASARLKAIDENKRYLTGVRERSAQEWAEKNVSTIEFYADAPGRIAWHREQGHAIFLVSGTIAPLARALAARLAPGGEIGTAATELQSFAGLWSGCAAGAAVCGVAKARAAGELAARHDLDLARSYAYGDSFADRWMLATVGNATAVNPGARLMWLARRRGWRVARWPRQEPGLEMPPDAAKQPLMPGERI
jgi:HAD superfamily hydrolase (TIGR01490 family)